MAPISNSPYAPASAAPLNFADARLQPLLGKGNANRSGIFEQDE
jgi:hypothetical protein